MVKWAPVLALARAVLGVGQGEAAELIGAERNTFARWERGELGFFINRAGRQAGVVRYLTAALELSLRQQQALRWYEQQFGPIPTFTVGPDATTEAYRTPLPSAPAASATYLDRLVRA
jgi:DNA-binding XRE family transcriptional regulator